MKEFADDNFKFDENTKNSRAGGKHFGKSRKIANQQFLLFPQCFQKTCTVVLQTHKDQGLFVKELTICQILRLAKIEIICNIKLNVTENIE